MDGNPPLHKQLRWALNLFNLDEKNRMEEFYRSFQDKQSSMFRLQMLLPLNVDLLWFLALA